jgi:cytochrome c oxidase subunit 5b
VLCTCVSMQDPFNMSVQSGPRGTREKPTLVPSMYEERIVGCICEEEATFITWQVAKKGAAHRCECGQFYQLVDANPTKIDNI